LIYISGFVYSVVMSTKPEIIAEIGTSHQGNLLIAEKLIREARKSGADTAKFQVVLAHEIIHPITGDVPLPGGNTPLYEVFEKLERPFSFYKNLKEMAEAEGLQFLASPFGFESLNILKDLGCGRIKIASPELNYLSFIKKAAENNRHIILSSGVSTLEDIKESLTSAGKNITLLHCITSYPAPEEQYNLNLIQTLKDDLNVKTGLSDHTLDPHIIPGLAVLKGAVIIEKHFTLGHDRGGLDDPIALNPGQFASMCCTIEKLCNMKDKRAWEIMNRDFGKERIKQILGNGVKKLAPSEKANYGRTNRSIHALHNIKEGTLLSSADMAVLRTEKILNPGLHPRNIETLINCRVKRNIPSGAGITWDDLMENSC